MIAALTGKSEGYEIKLCKMSNIACKKSENWMQFNKCVAKSAFNAKKNGSKGLTKRER